MHSARFLLVPLCFPISVPSQSSQLCCPWQLEHYKDSFSSLQLVEWLMQKERQEGRRGRLGAEVASPSPCLSRSSTEAKQTQPLLWGLQELLESQPVEFSRQGTAAGLGSVPLVQPQPQDSSAQHSTGSEGAQQDRQQHGRTSTCTHTHREWSTEKCPLHKQINTQEVGDVPVGSEKPLMFYQLSVTLS